INELKAKIEQKAQDVAMLKNEISNIEDKANKQKNVYEEKLMQKEKEYAVQIKELETKYKATNDQLMQKQEIVVNLQSQSEQDNALIRDLKEQVLALYDKVSKEKSAYEKILFQEKEKYLAEIRKNQTKKDDALTNLEKKIEDIDNLQSEIKKSSKVINDLKQQIAQLVKDRDTQKNDYEQILAKKDKEYSLKLKQLEIDLQEQFLSKERALSQQIKTKDKEVQTIQEQVKQKEKESIAILAARDSELENKLLKEKELYDKELKKIEASSKQLELELEKIKQMLESEKAKSEEKDEKIVFLNEKLDSYKNIKEIEKTAIIIQNENKRLQNELDRIEGELLQQKNMYQAKIAQQEKEMQNIQKDTQNKLDNSTANWDKKILAIESRYLNQIEKLETTNAQLREEHETQLNNVTKKLRAQVKQDEELKSKVETFSSTQTALMEEMLESKATMLLKLTQDFTGPQKEKAQNYFDRGMEAILIGKYSQAKYELEQVLKINPDNQETIDILSSLDFLLQKKQ
ncbi:MAG: hypothetical protein ABIG64_09950, partial [Candidatus Omnitrophota bacterium]